MPLRDGFFQGLLWICWILGEFRSPVFFISASRCGCERQQLCPTDYCCLGLLKPDTPNSVPLRFESVFPSSLSRGLCAAASLLTQPVISVGTGSTAAMLRELRLRQGQGEVTEQGGDSPRCCRSSFQQQIPGMLQARLSVQFLR